MPVRAGEASGAFRARAALSAEDKGLFASEVLSTLPRPTMVAVMPLTVPVKVGDATGA